MSKRAAEMCVDCFSAGVQTHLSNTLVSKCLTWTPTSIQNREVLGGLCLVLAFTIIPKHLQVVYEKDIVYWCLSAFLKPNWTTIPKLQTHEPHSVWDLWCLMVCCMEQGLLLALSVLLRIPKIVGGRELWRSSSPPSPRSRDICKWSEIPEGKRKQRKGEKKNQEEGRPWEHIFTSIMEEIYWGRSRTGEKWLIFCVIWVQKWKICTLMGWRFEVLQKFAMKTQSHCKKKVLPTAGYHPSSAYRHSGAAWPKKYSFWQGFSSAECECFYSAELN